MDLIKGWPNNKILPINHFKTHFDIHIEDLHYGSIIGNEFFRQTLSIFLNKLNENTKKEDLIITNGISHSILLLILIFKNITKKEIIVYVENPSYFLAFNIFIDQNLKVIPINNIKDIKIYEDKINLLYIIPFFQNPTGNILSNKDRDYLINILNKNSNFYILSDEAYQFFRGISTPKSLCEYNNNIISMGSFSKILSPGLRVGWIYTKNPNIIEEIKNISYLKSGGGVSPISLRIINNIVTNNLMPGIIGKIMDYIDESIKIVDKYLSFFKEKKFINYNLPKGGYFVWIYIEKYSLFLEKCLKDNIKVLEGNMCSINNVFPKYIRICVAFLSHDDLHIVLKNLSLYLSLINE